MKALLTSKIEENLWLTRLCKIISNYCISNVPITKLDNVPGPGQVT